MTRVLTGAFGTSSTASADVHLDPGVASELECRGLGFEPEGTSK